MLIEANVAVGFNPKPKLRNYIQISAYSIEELAMLLLNKESDSEQAIPVQEIRTSAVRQKVRSA